MRKFFTYTCAAFILFSLVNPVLAYDADDMAQDAKLLNRTKISLTDAIAIAEKHKNGKGFNASLDDYDGAAIYSVTVIQGDKSYDVEIDALTGEIADVVSEEHDTIEPSAGVVEPAIPEGSIVIEEGASEPETPEEAALVEH
ncbi:MAG: PepSY domain-containing protein [Alphaproteobacteria bacterium]|nr:PepSY domain-containing protein [Alphaproteobacteria bacterium]